MLKTLFIATILLANTSIFAQEIDDSQIITSFEFTKVEVEVEPASEFTATLGSPIGEITMILDGLLAIGTKVWPIVEAGKPVINTSGIVKSISVLPDFNGADPKREFYEHKENMGKSRCGGFRTNY